MQAKETRTFTQSRVHSLRLLSLALSVLAHSGLAMEAPAAPQTLPEEVIITGQQTISDLQEQLEKAEKALYGVFNELNDDDQYDVHCFKERRYGSLIKKQVCKPRFLRNATAFSSREFISDVQSMTPVRGAPAQSAIRKHYPILEQKMKALTREHPELFNAVAEHYELSEELRKRVDSTPDE